MKMKKFTAPTIAEAMKQIRKELGDDAVILNSKVVVTKRLLGLIQRKHFEVVAGIDTVEQKSSLPTFSFNTPFSQTTQFESVPIQKHDDNVIQVDSSISSELKKEIADLKAIMQSMNKQSIIADYPEELLRLIDFLRSQELDEELITNLSDELFTLHKQTPMNYEEMLEQTKKLLHEQLRHVPYSGLSYSKKLVHVLGPTGVGKTTTIAKMAARAVLEKKKKIGFITTDTYRIAAIEQLKTYAGLLQAPVEIVYSATDYEEALKKLAHLDLIFIDTAGRNYKEQKYVDDIQKLIRFDETSESYLVLSMTAKQKDLEMIIEQFSHLPIEKFIFTKVDETNSIGTMFNLMIKYNKGLAYYTNGQEVPEDIEQPTLDNLLNLFFQGEGK
jgi:flagellar biosynthesis protein FlhF